MAFSFDSLLALGALLLIGVAAYAFKLAQTGKPQVRHNLRFAAVLLAAPGVAGLVAAVLPAFLGAAFAAALLVTPLAAAALALGCVGPRPAPAWIASLALSAGLAAGLYAALLGAVTPALTVLILASAVMGFSAAPGETRWRNAQTLAGALALLAGGLALSQGALSGAFLLFSAGLLARALQAPVEQRGVLLLTSAIGRARL